MTFRQDPVIWEEFDLIASRSPDKVAVIDALSARTISYAGLRDSALFYSGEIKKNNIEAVVFIGEPSLDQLGLLLGCAHARSTFIPISGDESDSHVIQICSDVPANGVLISNRNFETDRFLPMGFAGFSTCFSIPADPISDNPSDKLSPFLVTYSSGSTGTPKPIAFSQVTKRRRTEQSIDLFGVTEGDIVLSASPLCHSLGQRHFFISILTGATLLRCHPFNTDRWVNATKRYQPTFAIPVANQIAMVLRHFGDDPELFNTFRIIVTSSAASDPQLKKILSNLQGTEAYEIYGMTETACVTCVKLDSSSMNLHVGAALRGVKIKLLNINDEGVGEVLVKTDYLCDGYWGKQRLWCDSLVDGEYFRSGDLGKFDGAGNLIFCGRTGDSYSTGGLTVYPLEVERVISELPIVSSSIVFGLENPIFGFLTVAVVQAQEPANIDQILQHCRKCLPKHMVPAKLCVLPTLPLLPSGKVDRRRVCSDYMSRKELLK